MKSLFKLFLLGIVLTTISCTQPEEQNSKDNPGESPIWKSMISAFPEIKSFPITTDVFPLQTIVVEGDTLKQNKKKCYYFPSEMIKDFVKNHVDPSDSLSIWLEGRGKYLGDGTDFDIGVYPLGRFQHASNNYFIYYVLDDLTGRGSFSIHFYLAKQQNQKWKSTYLGESSYYKFNTTKWVNGEEVFQERMVSEQNFKIDLKGNKLNLTYYKCDHAVGEEVDLFADEFKGEVEEIILD